MFDKIFRGYRIVSKSTVVSLSTNLTEEINIGFYTDYMSPKTKFRNVGESITIQWDLHNNTKLILPESGISENSMQLKGFLDWYERFNNPTTQKVIERLIGYGFVDITEDEELKNNLQNLLRYYHDNDTENLTTTENELIASIKKYDSGELKLSNLSQVIATQNNAYTNLLHSISTKISNS